MPANGAITGTPARATVALPAQAASDQTDTAEAQPEMKTALPVGKAVMDSRGNRGRVLRPQPWRDDLAAP